MAKNLDLSKITFDDVLDPLDNPPLVEPKEPKEPKVTVDKDGATGNDGPQDTDGIVIDGDKGPLDSPDGEPGEDGSDEVPFYDSLKKLLGYEVDGEFEESVEGVAEYTKKVAEKIAKEEVSEFFEAFPDVKEYLKFRVDGGEPSKFFEAKYSEPDYSEYKISEEDEVTQEVIVRKYLTSQNYTPDEINETIKDYRETNLLYKTASKVLDKLVLSQKSKRESILKKQEEDAELNRERQIELVNNINSTIDKGQLNSIVIPENDRKEFQKWLLNPISRDGTTKRQKVMNELTMEQKLELEYLVFKGFNLNDLVKKEATKTKIGFIKKSTPRLTGIGKSNERKGLDLSSLKVSDYL